MAVTALLLQRREGLNFAFGNNGDFAYMLRNVQELAWSGLRKNYPEQNKTYWLP